MPVTQDPQQQEQTMLEPTDVDTSVNDVSGQDTLGTDTDTYSTTTTGTSDANSIKVTISDEKAPLVVLFGPPACGKTMTLVRMSRFLKSEGYTISPVRTFRPSDDPTYKSMCDGFDQLMNTDYAVESTQQISFMLVEVIKDGRRVCQLLEAPGEHYFDPNTPHADFPAYVNTIISSPNRKIWMIMVEPNWKNSSDRKNYVARITKIKSRMRTRDSAIFVLNKVDKTPFIGDYGHVRTSSALNEVKNLYPGIFTAFKNVNPITKLWKEYNCDFVPFQTGTYTDTSSGKPSFQDGPREYCVKLWKCIMKKIRG